jgi:hypothetical protein
MVKKRKRKRKRRRMRICVAFTGSRVAPISWPRLSQPFKLSLHSLAIGLLGYWMSDLQHRFDTAQAWTGQGRAIAWRRWGHAAYEYVGVWAYEDRGLFVITSHSLWHYSHLYLEAGILFLGGYSFISSRRTVSNQIGFLYTDLDHYLCPRWDFEEHSGAIELL